MLAKTSIERFLDVFAVFIVFMVSIDTLLLVVVTEVGVGISISALFVSLL